MKKLLNEKMQILAEARKSYEKIVFNTTKLIDVLNSELKNFKIFYFKFKLR